MWLWTYSISDNTILVQPDPDDPFSPKTLPNSHIRVYALATIIVNTMEIRVKIQ